MWKYYFSNELDSTDADIIAYWLKGDYVFSVVYHALEEVSFIGYIEDTDYEKSSLKLESSLREKYRELMNKLQ